MSPDFALYITKYGYLAIFVLVFLQEVGAPNPIPNEIVLLFSGYLSFTGVLKLPVVILSALSADFIGTSILHTIFYFFGAYFLQHKPNWLPFPTKTIHNLSQRLAKKGLGGIYVCRLSPFIRGYTSVIAGLLQIKHRVFLPIALITAMIWSSAYIITGQILGAFYGNFIYNLGDFKYVMLVIFLFMITFFFLFRWRKTVNAKTKRSH